MAEIASPFVTSGGPYNWAGSHMAGRMGRLPSFVSGWVLLLSFFGGIASIDYTCAQLIIAMRVMYSYGDLSLVPTQKAQFGITVALMVGQAAIGCLPISITNRIAGCVFWWTYVGAAVLVIGLNAIAPWHQNGKFVFEKFSYDYAELPVEYYGSGMARASLVHFMRTRPPASRTPG